MRFLRPSLITLLLIICLAIFFSVTGCGQKSGSRGNVASLDDLNRALPAVAIRSGVFPPSTNELAKFLALSGKTMPVPPSGKKLEIDPGNHQFIFANH
jgi:hypothetical protein